MEFPSTSEANRSGGGEVPYVTASQASALLRSAMAISTELVGAAFPDITKVLLDELSGKWDFDVGSPLVQRLLAYKQADLQTAFLRHLKERQDLALNQVLARPAAVTPGNLQLSAETLSLVDAVTASSSTVVDRSAGKMHGMVEEPLRGRQGG